MSKVKKYFWDKYVAFFPSYAQNAYGNPRTEVRIEPWTDCCIPSPHEESTTTVQDGSALLSNPNPHGCCHKGDLHVVLKMRKVTGEDSGKLSVCLNYPNKLFLSSSQKFVRLSSSSCNQINFTSKPLFTTGNRFN